MQWKSANRLYTRQSLAQWSDRLHSSWEEDFRKDALKRGRKLYKRGVIKEISIGEDDAIMTCRFGKQESYSVVEWEEGSKLSIRSSSSDEVLGQAIAVAGILEIEELLADEDLFLLEEDQDVEDQNDVEISSEVGSSDDLEHHDAARMLHLVLDAHGEGLICEAYWLGEDGGSYPALGGSDDVTPARNADERGRLISLAARARKSHFVYSEKFNGYILQNIHEIPFFVSNVWPVWRKEFSTEERAHIANIGPKSIELEIQATASIDGSGALDLRWLLNAGKRLVSPEDLERLTLSSGASALLPEVGIVKLSGQSLELINRWNTLSDEAEASGGFKPYQLFSLFPDGKTNLRLEGELKDWADRLFCKPERLTDFLDCLRPYQREGSSWMLRLLENDCHCLLADEMGLGKTVQVIAVLKHSLESGNKALIVCPASVVPVWISEIERFTPELRARKYDTGLISRRRDEWDVLVTSFTLLRNRIERVKKVEFEFAVIDEAQFIKNPDAKSTKSCFAIRAKKRIALTGTPIENKPLDIWPAFNFLMPGLLGSRKSFETSMADNPGKNKALLREQIAPFMLRRTKEQVADDLPEKVVIDQHCPVTPAQALEYQKICEEGLKRLGDDSRMAMQESRFAALSLLTRLRQASCDPHLLPWVELDLEESGKLMVLLEKLIEILGTGHKVVIFSQFVRFLERTRSLIEASFPDLPIFEITGSTRDREAPVKAFQTMSETAVMLASLRAAGSGITLHAADYVFLLDPWWNPAVENQAIDRVHRIGQNNTVFVYKMIAAGTIEDKIQQLQREKTELFESVVGNGSVGADVLADQFHSLANLLRLAQAEG